MEDKKSFLMFYDWEPLLLMLEREDVGDLMIALYAFEIRGEIPKVDELSPSAWGLFTYLSGLIEENKKKWLQKQASGSLGGKKSAEARSKNQAEVKQDSSTSQAEVKHDSSTDQASAEQIQPKDKVKDKDKVKVKDKEETEKETSPSGEVKKSAPRFVPPTLDECRDYWKEKGFFSDPDTFFYFYEGKGWKVGKNIMQKWKAAASGWENRELKEHPEIKNGTKPKQSLDDIINEALAKNGGAGL